MISKYLLIIYLCSISTQQCNNGTVTGYSFSDHYDCAVAGYQMAQKAVKQMDRELVNKDRLAVKFECKEVKVNKT
ncbi:hypothetical protein HTVC168P_gp45 [Pelagibacter phage HTVC168P]|jgi:hypothetical protein|nr:hypothetical protein HTVC168P_gp45 [Pelagibacter phage HTVC168P]